MSQTPTPSAATGTNTNPKGQTPKENVRSLAAGLLNRLDVITLGEGNESAGVNTVVMMALTIANLSPPGSYLEDDAGCRIHVGMNVALGGGLSCGVVSDRVFTELQNMQGNFLEHIRLRMKYKDKEQQRLQDLKAAGQRSQDGTLPMMLDYLASSSGDMLREPGTGWHSLLQAPIHPELDRALETPAFFSKAGSVEALDTAVRFANYGRLLTHTAIHCRQDLALLEKLCREAALGNPNAKLLAAGVNVDMFVTDPLNLSVSALENGSSGGWSGRFLWLYDDEKSGFFGLGDIPKSREGRLDTGKRFLATAEQMLGARLDFRRTGPARFVVNNLIGWQAKWTSELMAFEKDHPGICGTLRPLMASLMFGLEAMRRFGANQVPPAFRMKEAYSLAYLLAVRMVNRRSIAVKAAERERLAVMGRTIIHKLGDGPLQVRDLVRKSHRINSAVCREVLEFLEESGQVIRNGKHWQLPHPSRSQPLTIDV